VSFADLTDEDRAMAEESSTLFDAGRTEAAATAGTDKTDDQVETLMLMERRRRRFACHDIIPHVARLVQDTTEKQKNKTMDAYRIMLKKAKTHNVTQKMKHLSDFDRSEAIIPHGQTSKKLFQEIFYRRPYDLYGRMQDRSLPPRLRLPPRLPLPPCACLSNPNLIHISVLIPPYRPIVLSPVTISHTTRKRRWWRWHGAWA